MPDPPSPDPPLRADNLEFLRKQAKKLLRDARSGKATALRRIDAVFSARAVARRRERLGSEDRVEADNSQAQTLSLAQAQLVIAREAGFASWVKLQDELRWREEVRAKHRLGSATPYRGNQKMLSQENLGLSAIDQIGLTCTDLEEARRFYCDVLGLREAGDVAGVMKFFDCDGVNIIMFKADSVPANSTIYFHVEGQPGLIEQKVALLKAKGVKVESDAHLIARNWNGADVWMAFFRDPFGNLLGLKSHVPVA